jgi:HAD superfamily hydrolase (TIGR01509 family)
MDGVLLDSEPLHFESFRRIFSPIGIDLPDEYQHKFVGEPLSKNLRDIENDFGLKLDSKNLKIQIQNAYLDILENSSVQPNEGICELLHAASQHGLKTGICTSSPYHQAEIIQQKIKDIYMFESNGPLFQKIVSGDIVNFTKPHPEPYLTLAKKLAVQPSKCIAIEDSFSGVVSSNKAGCYTIALKKPYNQKNDFLKADVIVASLKDIHLV